MRVGFDTAFTPNYSTMKSVSRDASSHNAFSPYHCYLSVKGGIQTTLAGDPVQGTGFQLASAVSASTDTPSQIHGSAFASRVRSLVARAREASAEAASIVCDDAGFSLGHCIAKRGIPAAIARTGNGLDNHFAAMGRVSRLHGIGKRRQSFKLTGVYETLFRSRTR